MNRHLAVEGDTVPDRIAIFDTTLRDGEQSPGCSMNLEEKVRMARQLDLLGVDVIEAGFPMASEDDFRAVHAVAREVRRPVIAALARTTRDDIERAWRAIEVAARPRLHTFVATSDLHMQHKLRKTRGEVLEMTVEAVRLAKSFTPDVEFSAEDATRTDIDFLCQVVRAAIEAGATTINIPTPSATRSRASSPASSPRCASACRGWSGRPCRCTATTISVWRWRTRWPPSRRGRGRSSAR